MQQRLLKRLGIAALIVAGVGVLSVLSTLYGGVSAQVAAAAISTDKTGYLRGETVSMSGSGFGANEVVTLQVTHAGGGAEAGGSHDTFTAAADAAGMFTATWPANAPLGEDAAGNNFVLTATRGPELAGVPPAAFSRIAVVGTDKYDYQPGEVATITGAGFNAGEEVTIQVEHSNGLVDGSGHGPFSAIAEADGSIHAQWDVDADDSLGSIFRLTATGAGSRLIATSTFTDILITIVDDAGADDVPGQKDLSFLQVNYTPVTPDIAVAWGWDDTAWPGNNTGDACALFDTNGNGRANYALCVTVGGSPATFLSRRLYSCGDDPSNGFDRCTQPTTLIANPTSSASASVVANSDPFGVTTSPYYNPAHVTGNTCDARTGCYTADTVANVTVKLSDLGGSAAKLTNVCSYPSQEPNSAPSECVITPNNGFLTIVKVADPNEGSFTFNSSAPSGSPERPGPGSWTINGSGTVQLISFQPSTTLDLNEVVPSGWSLTGASCVIQSASPTSTGTPTATGVDNLTIQSGLETVCTFNDQKVQGYIKVRKETVGGISGTYDFGFTPSGFGGNTPFTLSVAPNSSNETTAFGPLAVGGAYSLSETSKPSGWIQTDAVCKIGTETVTGPTNIVVRDGQTTICTFTNTENQELTRGKLKIAKVTDPSTDTTTSFGFTRDYASSPSFSLTGGAFDLSSSLVPGTYSATESTPPTGWTLSNLVCTAARTADGNTDPTTSTWTVTGASVSIVLGAGDTVTCTYTNTRKPTLTLLKTVVNDNGGTAADTAWTLNASGPTLISGIEGAATVTSAVVNAGTYTLTETSGPAGYTQTDLECTGATLTGNQITLANGQSATCTFVNNDDAPSLTLVKTVINDNGGTAVAGNWTLTAAGYDAASPDAGTYNLSESGGPAGYTQTSLTCSNSTGQVTSVTLGLGESVTCTFVNNDNAPSLTLVKTVDNTWCGSGCATEANFTLTAAGYDAASPDAGTYNLSETGPAGYAQTSLTCSNSTGQVTSVTLGLGESVSCTFVNSAIPAQLRVMKTVVPSTDGGLFNLQIDLVTRGTGNVGNAGTTGFIPVVANLQHTVGETAGTNTVLSDYVQAIGGPCASNGTITLGFGDSATCTITNTKKGMVNVLKLTNGVALENPQVGDPGFWSFTLNGQTVTGSHTTPPPSFDFSGAKLVPGAEYTLCETNLPAGWTSIWEINTATGWVIIPHVFNTNTSPVGSDGYSQVYDPNYVAYPLLYTNNVRCVKFVVDPDETVSFRVNNTFPGGDPRTIGFWKNWNTCTGGNQVQTAAKNGGATDGWYILDDLLNSPGLTLGLLQLDGPDCVQATRILDKSDIETGQKKASDPAYNMASQLLAAMLNYSAGAEKCLAADAAIAEGQAVLVGYSFNGTGNYAKRGTLANRALAVTPTLDQYNNGNLCQ